MTPVAIKLLRELYGAALAAADPSKVLPRCLPAPPKGRTVVVGVGKAGASMARAVEANWAMAPSSPRSQVTAVSPATAIR